MENSKNYKIKDIKVLYISVIILVYIRIVFFIKRSEKDKVMDIQNNLKAVFFDFGGTLMDTESDKIAHFHMMKAIKEHYQLPVTEEQLVNLYESQLFNHDMTIKVALRVMVFNSRDSIFIPKMPLSHC